jgi:hypothetical protein
MSRVCPLDSTDVSGPPHVLNIRIKTSRCFLSSEM